MIVLNRVTKWYGNGESVRALDGIDLEIAEGEFVAVMGPSGCGKSTLLSVLGGMNPPTRGRVSIDGIEVFALSHEQQADFRQEYVGFVFQQLQLLPYLTALENVMLPLAMASGPRGEKAAKARRALTDVGLDGKAHRLPAQLSGGEQGRVAIARAIVNGAPLLLADEPTGNLDRNTGAQILQLMKGLNQEGQTIVMVTHDQTAASYATRVIDMLDGKIAISPMEQEKPARG